MKRLNFIVDSLLTVLAAIVCAVILVTLVLACKLVADYFIGDEPYAVLVAAGLFIVTFIILVSFLPDYDK